MWEVEADVMTDRALSARVTEIMTGWWTHMVPDCELQHITCLPAVTPDGAEACRVTIDCKRGGKPWTVTTTYSRAFLMQTNERGMERLLIADFLKMLKSSPAAPDPSPAG